jgi:hypothetical protein
MQSAKALIHFELKYCERCGGLWLRPCAAAAVYCSPCARQMADIARRRLRRGAPCAKSTIAALTACLLTSAQAWLEIAAGYSA